MLSFTEPGGDINQRWLILKNDKTVIGLFEGMFESNMLTFNPGWDENGQKKHFLKQTISIFPYLPSFCIWELCFGTLSE